MPEVGVLNLTIHDNSETAAEGLERLTGALVSIQSAIGNGLKLSGVAGPLNKFANTVSANSKTFANVGTFLNAMKDYQRAFKDAENVKFNTEPLDAIKKAIGDGIKIGNAGTQINKIKEALGGGWDTAQSANIKTVLQDIAEGAKSMQGTNLGTTAKNVSATAKALSEYAEASRQIKSVLDISKGQTLSELENAPSRMKLNLQFHAGTGDFEHLSHSIKNITQPYKEFVSTLRETSNVARDAQLDKYLVSPLESMQQRFNNDDALSKSVFSGALDMAIPTIQKISTESLVATKNIEMLIARLNTPITYNGFDGIINQLNGVDRAAISAESSAKIFESIPKEKFELLTNTSSFIFDETKAVKGYTQAANAGLEASVRLNQELAQKYKDRPEATFEDIFFGKREQAMGKRSLMSEWLHGKGTETEQLYAFQEMARQFSMSVDEVKAKAIELGAVFNNVNPNSAKIDEMLGLSKVDLMAQRYDAMKQSIAEAYSSGQLTNRQLVEQVMHLQEYGDKLASAREEQDGLAGSALGLAGTFGALKTAMKKTFPVISNLKDRFKGMAIMRAMRYMVRQISAGVSEGIKNVYEYSKLIGGSFAPSMDSAATAIAQMKNSIGAALAPALQAIIPYVNQLVSWFISLINYVNQFFALLNGQATWTRALPATVNAFSKQEKAAKGAGAAMKDLLADWDELNIIQSQTGGGGGAGSATAAEDYLKMFEEVNRFDNTIKDITDFAKRNMNDILKLAVETGVAMKMWKLSSALEKSLPLLSKIVGWGAVGATIAISMKLTDMLDQEYVQTGKPGWLIASGLTGAVGSAVAWRIASKIAGGTAGIEAAGFTLVLSGLVDVKNAVSAAQQEKDSQAWALGAFGSLKAGIGTGLILAGLGAGAGVSVAGGMLVAGIVMLITMDAILNDKPRAIKWGNYTATAEEIKAFVEDKVFVVSPDTILNVIDPVVQVKNEKQEELKTEVAEVKLSVKKLTLGIDVDNTLDDLKEQVFGNSENGTTGIIGKFRETAEAMQNVIETGITLVPATNDDGEVKDIIDKTSDGWKLLNDHMDDLGKDLATHLAEAYKEGIDEKTKEMELRSITEISTMIANVSAAITQGQEREKLIQGLEQNLTNLTPESWGNMFNYIDQYKQAVVDAYAKAYDEVTQALAGEKSGLEQAMQNELTRSKGVETEKYKQYKAEYDYISTLLEGRRAGRKKALDDEAARAMDPEVVQRIREALLGSINTDAIRAIDVSQAFGQIGVNLNSTGALEAFLDEFFNADGSVSEYAKVKYDIFIDELLRSVYGDSYDAVKQAISAGFVGYEDLLPTEVVNAIVHGFLHDKDNKEVQDALYQFLNGQFEVRPSGEIDDIGKKDAQRIADEIREKYNDALNRGIPENSFEMDQILGELVGKYGDNTVAEALKLNAEADITIKEATIEFDDDIEEELRKQITDALNDNVIDTDERFKMDNMFGASYVEDVLQRMFEEGMNPDGTFGKIPAGMRVASTGINYGPNNVPVNYAPSGENNTIVTEPKDPQQEINNTASGVERGNRNLESLIRDLIATTSRMGDRPITVSLFPSSGWGNTNRQSEKKMEEVTGYSG